MLALKHINKQFAHRVIAKDINLSVQNGEMLAILGASGSGKSTLLHMIAGLQNVDSGEIYLNHLCINTMPPEKRQIAMMFQDFALLPHLNVWENVAFGLRLRGVKKAQARLQAEHILHEIGLPEMATRHIHTLSGGEQQRVALARALVISPQLLLLDEPFSSLDTAWRQQLQQQISQLIQKNHIPTILVSHDPAEAALTAQQLALLADGCIIQCGTPAELFSRPICAQAARLLGCLNVNDERYIPPQAIIFNTPNGTRCTIQQCFRQPLAWRVVVMHPKWGELIAFCDDEVARSLHGEVKVWIDETQLVYFQ